MMILAQGDFSPRKLGHDRHTAAPSIPVVDLSQGRLARLRARLAEAERQREHAFDALEQADPSDRDYLYRVYRANVIHVADCQTAVDVAMGPVAS